MWTLAGQTWKFAGVSFSSCRNGSVELEAHIQRGPTDGRICLLVKARRTYRAILSTILGTHILKSCFSGILLWMHRCKLLTLSWTGKKGNHLMILSSLRYNGLRISTSLNKANTIIWRQLRNERIQQRIKNRQHLKKLRKKYQRKCPKLKLTGNLSL